MPKQLKTSAIKSFPDLPVCLIAFAALVLRLVLMGYAQEVDSDGVSRVFTSWEWARDPFWYRSGVWAPLHYYLLGSGFLVWKDIILFPKVLNILLSVLMLFPFYFFVKREFNRAGAIYATVFLTLSPVLFRLGFLAMAEIPGLFFLILSMNLLSKGLREVKNYALVLAGISMTMAAGFRYEFWLMILLFTGMMILSGRWKASVLFAFFALIFPAVWMLQSYQAMGDALYSFHANTTFTHLELGINERVSFESLLRRIWFFPFSYLIALGPVAACIILKQTISGISKQMFRETETIWLMSFVILFLIMLYNAIAGNLLLQHRFTSTLVVLSLPFVAVRLHDFDLKTVRLAVVSVILMLGLSMVYSIGGCKPVPRLKNQEVIRLASIINAEASPQTQLVVDFIGWQDTWYTGLHSGIEPRNILMIGGGPNTDFPVSRIQELLSSSSPVIFVVRDNSELSEFLKEKQRINKEDHVTFHMDTIEAIKVNQINIELVLSE